MNHFTTISFLATTELFAGIPEPDIEQLLTCLGARERSYRKEEIIYAMGETIDSLGILLTGAADITTDDYLGNHSMLSLVTQGDIFGEVYAALPQQPLMINITAREDCRVLFLSMPKISTTCMTSCDFHHRLVLNLLALLSRKNLALSRRHLHTAPKSIRERLLAYFSTLYHTYGSLCFQLPYTRQELADYLNVNRSALSHELSKMQADGLLTAKGRHITLHQTPDEAFL